MLNKVHSFIREYGMVQPGDHVVCAVSGGADSVALLWAMYLLREKLGITLSAAHYNHGLRGEESQRDQQFVQSLCQRYDIPLAVQEGNVTAGKKGLEAAAREARYGFLTSLPGKIATAHTADDNAETVLMHIVRGTGLKGLGGISPVRDQIIRPMLSVTRSDVLAFLQEYHLSYVDDSSNRTDQFLRNRLRHRVMPLLQQENPCLLENLSQMALRLRQDEQVLTALTEGDLPTVSRLRQMPQALRRRHLCRFLESAGVKEPESRHIALAEELVFSTKPSATAVFSGGITICRQYDQLQIKQAVQPLEQQLLYCGARIELPGAKVRVICEAGQVIEQKPDCFTVFPNGEMVIRSRCAGDRIRLMGGTKGLKELFIDRKIPVSQRVTVPVIADASGVLAVYGFGANLDRTKGEGQPVIIRFESIDLDD